ncbi:GATA zinc finger domain-containing protein 14-like [Venturia canescens]|uniref:GATA zinc finger domain-containing protein 14-like n=1 Tax=Venturia canescens TaxID=32260 RepID=UPI001C9BE8CA|nr:GATA zinc finger domain-containing protein 14-like [Venturia canescens]
MMGSKGSFFVVLLTIAFTMKFSVCDTRYFVKVPTNSTDPLSRFMGIDKSRFVAEGGREPSVNRADASNPEKSRSSFRIDDETMIRESLKANLERRNSFIESSTFDPDVLNKFLDDYANKIKSTTEKNYNFPFRIGKPDLEKLNEHKNDNEDVVPNLEPDKVSEVNKTIENSINSTLESTDLNQQDLNDTIKRNKYFGGNANDDRNGWVTLEAIPWSKSKISKWQASSSSQRPWPDMQSWDKPSNVKPWNSEFPSRPAYINNEPWPEPPKVQRPDYHSSRPIPSQPPRPQVSTRPSYFDDRFDHNLNQAQKWPPERPQSSWDKFPSTDSYKPNLEIITDDRPSNFPTSWDKYTHSSSNNNNKYSYNDRDRFTNNYDGNNNHHHHQQNHQHEDSNHDWREPLNNYPSKFELYKDKPSNFGRPTSDYQSNRPQQLSHYQYTPEHPPSHPSNGEGQWVLLSTNRGYSKSRQRSMKMDNEKDQDATTINTKSPARVGAQDDDGTVAVMTSKRQVRLTVLPSINGTNTTTSHGGLLEVEKTFKTVDQSRKEYEDSRLTTGLKPFIVNHRPIRNTVSNRPSNSAVLAAVGAGMLPATMAVMIPMMLGRKKRSSSQLPVFYHPSNTPSFNYHEKFVRN